MFSALPPKDGVIGRPSLWIAEDFWLLRFRLMVKRGPLLRPQASEGEAQHGPFCWIGRIGQGDQHLAAPDYLALLQALLNGGSLRETRILRPETVALMSKNQIGELEAGILKTTNPALANDVDFFPGGRLRGGLGPTTTIDPRPGGRRLRSRPSGGGCT